MNFEVSKNSSNIIYKKVFAHPVYKQALLYQYKVNGIKEFTLSGPDDVLQDLKDKISIDCDLESLDICYLPSDPSTQRPSDPFISMNLLYYSPNSYIDINSEKDIKVFRKKRAQEILKNTQTPVAKYINKRISLPLSYILIMASTCFWVIFIHFIMS